LILGNTFTHSGGGRDTSSDGHEQIIGILSTTPSLVGEDVCTELAFWALDKFYVGFHSLFSESLSEEIANVSIRMQATQRDKLPNKAEFAKLPNVIFHILLIQTGSFPIEARAQVVSKPLTRNSRSDTFTELFRLGQDRFLRFHPE